LLVYDEGVDDRKKFLIKRAIAFLALGIFFVQVLPSLADVLTPNPEPSASASPVPSELVASESPSPQNSPSSSPSSQPSPQTSGSYSYLSPSESPTAEPALADEQDVILRMPSKFPVDPRATSLKIAPITLYSSGDVILCLSTSGTHFWLSQQSDSVLIKGNNSKSLTLSGDAGSITTLLATGQGLRVGGAPRVQGVQVVAKAASVTKPTLNADFCAEAPRVIQGQVVALGLGMDTVKNPVPIK